MCLEFSGGKNKRMNLQGITSQFLHVQFIVVLPSVKKGLYGSELKHFQSQIHNYVPVFVYNVMIGSALVRLSILLFLFDIKNIHNLLFIYLNLQHP